MCSRISVGGDGVGGRESGRRHSLFVAEIQRKSQLQNRSVSRQTMCLCWTKLTKMKRIPILTL